MSPQRPRSLRPRKRTACTQHAHRSLRVSTRRTALEMYCVRTALFRGPCHAFARSKCTLCAQYPFGTRTLLANRGQRAQQLPLKSRFHARAPNRRRRGREFLGLRGATQGRERPARGEFVHAHGAAGSRVERVVRLSFPDRECTARRGPWPKLCSRSSALFLSARA